MDQSDTTNASPDAATASTDAVANATATPSSEPTGTTQPSAEAAPAASTPSEAQAANGSFATHTRSASTQPTTQPASTGAAPQDSADYKKRWEDAQPYIGRLSREAADLRKYREQWGDLNPQQVREMMQRQQADAQQRQLKPWHPQHPNFSQTEARLTAVRSFASARETIRSDPSIDDGTKARLISQLAERNQIGAEDVALYREHEQHVASFNSRMARDPEGTIADIVQRRVEDALQRYDSHYRSASAATDQWLSDPKRSQLLEKYTDDMLQALDPATSRRDLGLTIAQLKAENEALKGRVGNQREVVEQSVAQQAALKKRSTVVRDAVSAPRVDSDPVAEASKLGLTGSALIAHLRAQRSAAVAE
jgi:hypothetical protein